MMPHYCTNCLRELVNGVCPDCGQEPTTTSTTTTAPSAATVETPRFELTEACLKSHGLSENMANVVYGALMGAKRDLAASQQRCGRLEAIIEKIAAAFDRWKYGQCSDVDFHDIVKRTLTKEPR